MLFVGEKRSQLAIKMGVTWEDGRLAAKQLFDALEACDIDPQKQKFCNWFEDGGKEIVRSHSGTVVAMGLKVKKALEKEGIPHLFIYHPAARGKIRKKELYESHVRENLCLTRNCNHV